MTDDPADRDGQLRRAVATIVRLYLEWQRGLRPLDALKPLLTDDARDRLRADRRIAAVGGPVTRGDIVGVHVQRPDRDGPYRASAAVRDAATDRWQVILVEVARTAPGRWQVTDLRPGRELDGPDHTVAAAHQPRSRPASDRLLVTLGRDRLALVDAAEHAAARVRANQQDPQARDRLRYTHQRLTDLDRRIRNIAAERDQLSPTPAAPSDPTETQQQRRIERQLFGSPPAAPEAREQRRHAIGALWGYQQRWGIDDAITAFALSPDDPAQIADWRATLQHIGSALSSLTVDPPGSTSARGGGPDGPGTTPVRSSAPDPGMTLEME